MGLRGITLNTPPEEEAHIIAEDDAAIYQSIFGEDGVFTIGDRMKATVINNNQVRVSNGVICVGGHIARTVYGDYSDMTIENGEISKNRNDIITAVFSTTGEKGIDKFKIEVKKGTPGVVAEDPELTKENLYEGGKLRELPLWRVKLEGINIIGVEQMFKIIHKIPDLEEMIESLNGKSIFESGTSGNWKYNKWSNGDVELWYEGILPFANKTDAGLSGIFMTIANVSLPFQIKNGVTFASLKWAYTEWCTSYLTNDNRVQIRKFSNANSAGITDQRCAIYVKGKY